MTFIADDADAEVAAEIGDESAVAAQAVEPSVKDEV